jgi:hypothetical protein
VEQHKNILVNMVFHLPAEISLSEAERAQIELGAARAIFEKPGVRGAHEASLHKGSS